MEAGDGRGLAGGSGAVACPVSGRSGQQDAVTDVRLKKVAKAKPAPEKPD